jgi:hypothetical protein
MTEPTIIKKQFDNFSIPHPFINIAAYYNVILLIPEDYIIPPDISCKLIEDDLEGWSDIDGMPYFYVSGLKLLLPGRYLLFYDKETEDSKRLNSYIEQIKNYNNHDNT